MFDLNPEYIRSLLDLDLPGENSHRKMIPPGKRLSILPDELENVRFSSVLILLFPYNGQINICLTKRNKAMKHHPGQISFPGGRIEEGESPDLTALRETYEEIGVLYGNVEILGKLSDLYIPVSQYSIYPFVGWMDYKPNFVLNYDEVEEIIFLPIESFLENRDVQTISMQTSTGILDVPYFPYKNEVIWGATAMILSEFFDLLDRNVVHMQVKNENDNP